MTRRRVRPAQSKAEYEAMLAEMSESELELHLKKQEEHKARRAAEQAAAKLRREEQRAQKLAKEAQRAQTSVRPDVSHVGSGRRRRQRRRIPNAWRNIQPGVGLCTACGVWAQLTKDHITPLAHGGTWDLDNMQLICETCNIEKGESLTWQPPLKRRSWQNA